MPYPCPQNTFLCTSWCFLTLSFLRGGFRSHPQSSRGNRVPARLASALIPDQLAWKRERYVQSYAGVRKRMEIGGISGDECDKNVVSRGTWETERTLMSSMIYEGKGVSRPCWNRKIFWNMVLHLGLSLQHLGSVFLLFLFLFDI